MLHKIVLARKNLSYPVFCHKRCRIYRIEERGREDVLRTEDMIPTHGLAPVSLGRRTRSLGRGGRRIAIFAVEAPLAGIVMMNSL